MTIIKTDLSLTNISSRRMYTVLASYTFALSYCETMMIFSCSKGIVKEIVLYLNDNNVYSLSKSWLFEEPGQKITRIK